VLLPATGRPISASASFSGPDTLSLRPNHRLASGTYTVLWHSVSALDGHALSGSFQFGVEALPSGAGRQYAGSDSNLLGVFQAGLRALWYLALFFFGGGVLCGVLLRSPAGLTGWLIPSSAPAPGAPQPSGAWVGLRAPADPATSGWIWGRTYASGWIAVATGAGVVLADTWAAGGSLSGRALRGYLLSTMSGSARPTAVLLILIAVLTVNRLPRLAALAILAALAAIALGGHANSASPRLVSLGGDWVHLVAGMVWVGGIAQIAVVWLPGVLWLGAAEQRRVIRHVLGRFGRIALPAFLALVLAGLTTALLELGAVRELWSTEYGFVLLVKMALVATIALASYGHALRLRPRLLAAGDDDASLLQRRHWRLLGIEPPLAALVLTAGALLAVIPQPGTGLVATATPATRPGLQATAGPGPPGVAAAGLLPAPSSGQLAVAEEAGPWIAAAWINASEPAGGTVRLLNASTAPVPAAIEIDRARTAPCGPGCATFRLSRPASTLTLHARLGGRTVAAVIPIGWIPGQSAVAAQILAAVVARTDHVSSYQIHETLRTGQGGPPAISHYRIEGRQNYQITYHSGGFGETIGIGRRSWVLEPGGSWQEQTGPPFDTRQLMPWWSHRIEVRLLAISGGDDPTAEIALADIHSPIDQIPFWFRLRVDLRSRLVLDMRMIGPAHFMNQSYYGFDAPGKISPPPSRS
jgi:copper transport protein